MGRQHRVLGQAPQVFAQPKLQDPGRRFLTQEDLSLVVFGGCSAQLFFLPRGILISSFERGATAPALPTLRLLRRTPCRPENGTHRRQALPPPSSGQGSPSNMMKQSLMGEDMGRNQMLKLLLFLNKVNKVLSSLH